jgi:hypothetical protein
MVHSVSQQQAFDLACKWATDLGCPEVGRCVLLEQSMGASRARAVVHYGQELSTIKAAKPVLISEVMHLEIGELATKALLQVLRMAREVTANVSEAVGWTSGSPSAKAGWGTH